MQKKQLSSQGACAHNLKGKHGALEWRFFVRKFNPLRWNVKVIFILHLLHTAFVYVAIVTPETVNAAAA